MTLVRALFCLGLVTLVPACPGEDDSDGDGTTTTSGPSSNEPDDVQLAVDGGLPDACDDEGEHDLPPVE